MATVMHRKPVARGPPSMMPKQPPTQPYYTQDRQHSRTRTNSSSAMPFNHTHNHNSSPPRSNISPAYSMTSQQLPPPQQPPYPGQTRRTLSNATSSTESSQPNNGLQRVPTGSTVNTTSGIRRSVSSRSNSSSVSPTSYVALMRKQKGTVWCDRAQNEDPRILAAHRQAKMRAAAEVAGGHYGAHTRTSTSSSGMVGGVRSKIRHHGAPKASAYNSAMVGGAGVPMRLSASEVDDGNDSDDDTGARYHVRNGSGRSSVGSGRRAHSYVSSNMQHSYSNGSTPAGGSPVDSMDNVLEEETPMPTNDAQQTDYFSQPGGSGHSGEQEESFGSVSNLPQTTGQPTADEKAKRSSVDDLRRRGSVDDRTMTMSGVRLFVANPDLSD